MKTARVEPQLYIRIRQTSTEELSPKEVQGYLTEFFTLLWEIDQEHNVTKEYFDEHANK